MSQTILTLVLSDFRTAFKAFSNVVAYPDAVIQMFFDNGTFYVSNVNVGILNGSARQLALYYMTAHLLQLNDMAAEDGGAPAELVQDAQVDKIRVSLTPPTVRSQFGTWLNLTSYGQNLWGLLVKNAAGGFYIGGNPETAAFRRVGGIFAPGC